ncbi:MAG TPA: exosortase H [Desulfuromonadales bacterium]|nr:exosortase H [Desulfuromonadales bacterium]
MHPHQTDILLPDTAAPTASPPWLRFALLCTLFLLASIWLETHLLPLNGVIAGLSAQLLALCGYTPLVAGDLITVAGFSVRIVLECTAIHPILIYVAFVLAHPGSLRRTLTGLAAGSTLLFSVNIARIALVTLVGARWPLFFELLHVYLGQVVMLLLVLAAALAWQRCGSEGVSPLPFVLRALLWASMLFLPWVVLNKYFYMNAVDALVFRVIAALSSHTDFSIERPVALYNHTFALPLYLAMVLAVGGSPVARRLKYTLAGSLIIVGWHIIFRIFQVSMEIFKLNELQPLYLSIYLGGQFLVPLLLWVCWFGPPRRSESLASGGVCGGVSAALLVCTLLWPGEARAEARLIMKQTGSNVYQLEMKGLERITRVTIALEYVLQGAASEPSLLPSGLGFIGSLKIESSHASGDANSMTIVYDAARPHSGDGMLGTLTLTRRGGAGVMIGGMRAAVEMQNYKGVTIAAASEVEDAAPGTAEVVKDDGANAAVIGKASSAGIPMVTPAAAKTGADVTRRSLKGVLVQFLESAGERTTEVLADLVARRGEGGDYRQEPSLLLSDGVTPLRVLFHQAASSFKETPSFVIKGAEFGTFTWLPSGELAVDVLPDKGALRASITIITKEEQVEYPLAIAPPLEQFDASRAGAGEAEYVAAANRLVRGNVP